MERKLRKQASVAVDTWTKDADLASSVETHGSKAKSGMALFMLAYSSIGVVYGDIGTSPLYVFASTFHQKTPSPDAILGALSLIFWTLTLIVMFKYVCVVMAADDNGEGGAFALYSLICRSIGIASSGSTAHSTDMALSRYSTRVGPTQQVLPVGWGYCAGPWLRKLYRNSPRLQQSLLFTVAVATAMVIGDGILTPAISVLSAVSGLEVATDAVTREMVIGITVAILVALFSAQRFGTEKVGLFFAPIIVVWLVFNAAVGIVNLATYGGEVFQALNPAYIIKFFQVDGLDGWISLGGIMLCMTGAEAIFADMGHYSRRSIRLSCSLLVFPCLILTYFGQGAYLITHPQDVGNAFWAAIPPGAFWPMLITATAASVVASQALISGSFSIIRQAMAHGMHPKFTIYHTGDKIEGQVYIAEINWMLMVLTVAVVAGFQDTESLGNAYGVAVMAVMVITTVMVALVALMAWNMHMVPVLAFLVFFFCIESVYLSATLVKVPQGGWLTLLVAAAVATVNLTWHYSSSLKRQHMRNSLKELDALLLEDKAPSRANSGCNPSAPQPLRLVQWGIPVHRLPGLAIYYSETVGGAPPVLEHILRNVPAVYDVVVFLTVRFVPVPYISIEERFLVKRVPRLRNFYHVVARYGYVDKVTHDSAFVRALVSSIVSHVLSRAEVPRAPSTCHSMDRSPVKGSMERSPAKISMDRSAGKWSATACTKDGGATAPPRSPAAITVYASGDMALPAEEDGTPSRAGTSINWVDNPIASYVPDVGAEATISEEAEGASEAVPAPARAEGREDGTGSESVPKGGEGCGGGVDGGEQRDEFEEGEEQEGEDDCYARAPAFPFAAAGSGVEASAPSMDAFSPRAPALGRANSMPDESFFVSAPAAAHRRSMQGQRQSFTGGRGDGVEAGDGGDTADANAEQHSLAMWSQTMLAEANECGPERAQIDALLRAHGTRVVYNIGRVTMSLVPGRPLWQRVLVGGLYRILCNNSRPAVVHWSIPTKNLVELGMVLEV